METNAEIKSSEAIQAATSAQEAIEIARAAQIAGAVEGAIAKFFDRGVAEKRFIDVGRIPFICDDLRGIHLTLADQTSDIKWVKWLVMGMTGGVGALVISFLVK